jgi:hypothetical protein
VKFFAKVLSSYTISLVHITSALYVYPGRAPTRQEREATFSGLVAGEAVSEHG